MKRNKLMGILPMAAGIALTGTGFGAWVFTNDLDATIGTKIVLANAISTDNLTLACDYQMDLKQIANPQYKGNDGDNSKMNSGGVTITTDISQHLGLNDSNAETPAGEKWVLSENGLETVENTLTYKIVTKITGDIANYVEYKDATIGNAVNNTVAEKDGKDSAEDYEYTSTFTINSNELETVAKWTPMFIWTTGKAPNTLEEWQDLYDVLDTSHITFTVSLIPNSTN